MSIRMQPMKDANGNYLPELDKRDVPLSLMAEYMGIHPQTLYQQVLDDRFPKAAIAQHGARKFYRPWVWVQVREPSHV